MPSDDSNKMASKKKNRPHLSIKIFSGNKKKDLLNNIYEYDDSVQKKKHQTSENKSPVKSPVKSPLKTPLKTHPEESLVKTPPVKTALVTKDDTDTSSSSSSEDEKKQPPPAMAFRVGRRRSLSACADVSDTMLKIRDMDLVDADKDVEEEEEEEDDLLSPLPVSPTKSCLRMRSFSSSDMIPPTRARSATFSEGEDVEFRGRQRAVSFSPDTVDPPPRNVRYREWIESRSKAPVVNVKHEQHKQKMSQLKKVNVSDFLVSKKQSGLLMGSTSAFGGGGMMM